MVHNIGKRNKQRGAEFEREIASIFGGSRIGTRGKPDEEHADIAIHGFRIQCKRRKRLGLSSEWWDVLDKSAKVYRQVPVLAIREDYGDPLVLMKADHFLSIADVVVGLIGEEKWLEFLEGLSQK